MAVSEHGVWTLHTHSLQRKIGSTSNNSKKKREIDKKGRHCTCATKRRGSLRNESAKKEMGHNAAKHEKRKRHTHTCTYGVAQVACLLTSPPVVSNAKSLRSCCDARSCVDSAQSHSHVPNKTPPPL